MAPFYGWGSTASRLQPLQGGSLRFTTKFPEIPGTHFIKLRRMKGTDSIKKNNFEIHLKLQNHKDAILRLNSFMMEAIII